MGSSSSSRRSSFGDIVDEDGPHGSMEYRRDTTPTQDHLTSLRRNGRTNPPLLRAVRVPRSLRWLYLVFELRRLSPEPSHPTSIPLALVGDDHFIVVPCLVRADTLASSIHIIPNVLIISSRPRHEPSSPQDSSIPHR